MIVATLARSKTKGQQKEGRNGRPDQEQALKKKEVRRGAGTEVLTLGNAQAATEMPKPRKPVTCQNMQSNIRSTITNLVAHITRLSASIRRRWPTYY